jgi:hypothetical protein
MRVNIYAEEMTERVEIISKEIEGRQFTGLRFYLELPVTVPEPGSALGSGAVQQVSGPFMHHPGDDDSAAVTFWGKRDLRVVLRKALAMLDRHYEPPDYSHKQCGGTFQETRTATSLNGPWTCDRCGSVTLAIPSTPLSTSR